MKNYAITTKINGRKYEFNGNSEKDVVSEFLNCYMENETNQDDLADCFDDNGNLTVELNEDLFWKLCDRNVSTFEKTGWFQILKDARKDAGYTQQEVADKIGTNIRIYQRWENGEVDDIMASSASKLCKLLNLDYEIFE